VAYFTSSDIQARLAARDYLRVFDRDGNGVADAAFVATCIAESQSELDMRLLASFPTPLDDNGALIDERIKGAGVAIALYAAVRYNPLATGDLASAYRQAYTDALEFLDRLRKDDGERLKTSAGGRALPRAANDNLQSADGVTTSPFSRAADLKDPSGY
jgi:phage gp36-like protein